MRWLTLPFVLLLLFPGQVSLRSLISVLSPPGHSPPFLQPSGSQTHTPWANIWQPQESFKTKFSTKRLRPLGELNFAVCSFAIDFQSPLTRTFYKWICLTLFLVVALFLVERSHVTLSWTLVQSKQNRPKSESACVAVFLTPGCAPTAVIQSAGYTLALVDFLFLPTRLTRCVFKGRQFQSTCQLGHKCMFQNVNSSSWMTIDR